MNSPEFQKIAMEAANEINLLYFRLSELHSSIVAFYVNAINKDANHKQNFHLEHYETLIDVQQAMQSSHFDVMLINVESTKKDHIAAVDCLRKEFPDTRIILILQDRSDRAIPTSLKDINASDYFFSRQLNHKTLSYSFERVLSEERLSNNLHSQKIRDDITSLINKDAFGDRLLQACIRDDRHSNDIGLILIDIDNFHRINDRYGHHIGNSLLLETAFRLEDVVRYQDTVARVDSNTFAIILESIKGRAGLLRVIEKLQTELQNPFTLGCSSANINFSIAVALRSEISWGSCYDLVNNAERTLEKIKQAGGRKIEFATDNAVALTD